MITTKPTLFSEIENFIKGINPKTISNERKEVLQPLIDFIQSKVSNNQEICINFICTHNSRRSHLSQIWAQTLANYFNIKNVFCYSGFQIKTISKNENPIYSIKYADNEHPIIGFSKK